MLKNTSLTSSNCYQIPASLHLFKTEHLAKDIRMLRFNHSDCRKNSFSRQDSNTKNTANSQRNPFIAIYKPHCPSYYY